MSQKKIQLTLNGVDCVTYPRDSELLVEFLHKRGLYATKVGCGEGGCGACSVLIERDNNFFPINSCLRPLSQCEGDKLWTLEGLKKEKKLGLAAKTLAECGGSQCGFCSPGIVVTLTGTELNTPKREYCEDIEDLLAGNLCRCTGYRSIKYAAKKLLVQDSDANLKSESEETPLLQNNDEKGYANNYIHHKNVNLFDNIIPVGPVHPGKVKAFIRESAVLPKFHWEFPETFEEIFEIFKKNKKTKFVMGNTSMGIYKKDEWDDVEIFISMKDIKIKDVDPNPDYFLINHKTTVNQLLSAMKSNFPKSKTAKAIAKILRRVAGHQVRNAASVVGSIALVKKYNFLSDTFLALATANAEIHFYYLDSNSNWVFDHCALINFLLRKDFTDFLITNVIIPIANSDATTNFINISKTAKRLQNSHSLVNGGFRIPINNEEKPFIAFGNISDEYFVLEATADLWHQEITNGEEGRKKLLETARKELTDVIKDTVEEDPKEERISLALGFLTKTILRVQGTTENIDEIFEQRMEHVSKGKQEFNINIMETPISEPIVKITALEQTEGELQYVQTIPSNLALHALPILSSKPNGKIQWLLNPQQIIDQIINPYLGDVNSNIHFFIAADLGKANQLAVPIKDEKSQVTYPSFGEWLLADKEVAFFGQAIAILVTDENWKTQKLSRYLFDPKVQSQFISIESQDPPILNVEESIKKEDKTLFNTVAYQNNVPSYRSIDYISNLPGASDDINWDQFNGDENVKIIKGKHKVGAQYHFYMETQSAIATRNGNFVDIWASTQSAASVAGNCTSLVNKMPRDQNDSEPLRANISIPSIGGGFGGKEPQSKYVALIAAFCAVKLGKTVRCVLDRNTDMRMIGKRHAVLGKYKVAATKDGEIKAMEIIYNLDAGNNYDCSLPVMDLMLLTAENAYDVPQFVAKGRCYFSNKPTSTAFRSFGVVQSHQITEFAIQNVAEELGMNSAEFRQKNFFKFKPKSEEKEEDFPKTPYGQKLIACNLNNVWSGLMKRFNSKKVHDQVAEFNNKNNYKKRGYSVLPLKYGISFTTTKMNISRAYLNFTDDGKIIVRTLGVEMGQGLHTKLLQIASYAFKVSIKDIIIDTTATQWYGQDLGKYPGTGASTGTDLNGRAILQLREGFNQVLKTLIDDQELWKEYEKNNNRWYSPALYNDNQQIIKAEVDLWARVKTTIKPLEKDIIAEMTLQPFLSDVQHDTKQGTPFYYFNYAAAYSVVEVDCLTGEFEIIETEILYDAGVSINPGIDIGQIEGGFVQGVGYVSCEAIEYGKDGNLITDGTWTYKIPSTTEIPRQLNVTFFPQREDGEINTKGDVLHFNDEYFDTFGVQSSKTTGEPPLVLANTVYFAIRSAVKEYRKGKVVLDCPATTYAILRALNAKNE